MNKLIFIGRDGSFSANSNNSAYLIKDDIIVLFDCGETVFKQLLSLNILNANLNKIYIIVTHFHSDHVGSLGRLIFFCRYKKIKCNVVFPNLQTIRQYLQIIGIDDSLYKSILPCNIPDFYLREYPQVHGDYFNNKFHAIPTYGYHFISNNYNFYFSGDSLVINKNALRDFLENKIEIMYHDVSFDSFPVHLSFNDLCKSIPLNQRKRVYCMHISGDYNIEKIRNNGFNVVKVKERVE